MKFTRMVSVVVAAASLGLSGFTALQAQSLRSNQTPAEFPPASYKGKQYVDSRGCIFIRAGIDGNVTWVPRVSRDRRLVCGYKPSLPPGAATTTTAAAPRGPAPEQITLPPSAAAPAATASASAPRPDPLTELLGLGGLAAGSSRTSTPSPAPEPTVFENPTSPAAPAAPKPAAAPTVRTTTAAPAPRTPSPAPKPTIFTNPAPATTAAPATAATARTTASAPAPRRPSPAPAPTVFSNPTPKPAPTTTAAPARSGGTTCPGASALSQQYINSGSRYPVRCGPQAEAPVTIKGQRGSSLEAAPQGSVAVAAAGYPVGTRVVPRHVYDNRQNTQNVTVPKGYRTVWEDDRLNPRRAERTTAPYTPRERTTLPKGYRVAWDDGRLNRNRGGTASGDSDTRLVWSDTVPRKLIRIPTDRQVVVVPQSQNVGLPRARTPVRSPARASQSATRQKATAPASTPNPATTKPRYIRVATFGSDAEARAAGKALARRTGLSVRLGTLTRKGKAYRVVMAGPYSTQASADTAMAKVRGAGYPRARLGK